MSGPSLRLSFVADVMNKKSPPFSMASVVIFSLLILVTGRSVVFAGEIIVEVRGDIALPGDYSIYSYSVSEESFFYFDLLTNATGPRWSLSGPAGSVVSARAMRRHAGAENMLLITNHYRVQGVKQSPARPSTSAGTIRFPPGRCKNNTQNFVR